MIDEPRTAVAGNGTGMPVAGWSSRPGLGIHAALFLTSAALLTLEVSLTRFFSHTIWYHLAYLTISVALLGFGCTGSIVAAFPGLIARRGNSFLVASLALGALVAVAGLSFLAQFPIQIENLTNKPLKFSASLMVYYVIVGAPFVLAGFSVSVPFAAYPQRMGRLYFWDLAGAALGCAFVVTFIEILGVPGLVFAAAGMMLLAAAALAGAGAAGLGLAAAGALAIALAGPASSHLPVLVTGTKNLPALLEEANKLQPLDQRSDSFSKWTAINRVDAFGWDHPSPHSFWSRIGLADSWKGEVPGVARLTYDGGNGSDVYGSGGDVEGEFRFLEHHMLRLPYLLLDQPNVLAIGVGGGIDLFNAVKQGARRSRGARPA